MLPIFFKIQEELRKWFEKNYLKETEAWIGFYNKKSGNQSITWQQLVDEELCFGWIDGIRKKIDDESYCNRITPRRKNSHWSQVNINRIQALMEAGLVKEEGKKVFRNRNISKQKLSSFEQKTVELPTAFKKQFQANKKAWQFFEQQSNSYKKQAIWHVISAKLEETKHRRLKQLIQDSEQQLRLNQFRRK